MEREEQADAPPWYWAPWRFVVESLVGLFVFLVIAAGAVALSLITTKLEEHGIDRFIVYGLKGAEYFIFGVDLLLFACFWLKTAWRTFKGL